MSVDDIVNRDDGLRDPLPDKPCDGEKKVKWIFRHSLCRYDWKRDYTCPDLNKGLLVHGMDGNARYECTKDKVKYGKD